LQGYVATTPKPRAETPLWSDKGDPLLAHWQYGLGRAVAFTSDAKARWAHNWLEWAKYRQFWAQIGQWSLRRLENADFTTEVSVEKGDGLLTIDAADEQGNYRNFLNLQVVAVSPKGQRVTVRAQQTGPGHYEAQFPTREVGSYLLNVLEVKEGQVLGSQVVGASVNYSPEFNATEPNVNLLRRLAESGSGRVLEPAVSSDNPFLHDRQKTFQPRDLWEWLLQFAVLAFVADVGVRRVQLDDAEVRKWLETMRRRLFPSYQPKPAAEESLNALLERRYAVRAQQQTRSVAVETNPALFQPRQLPTESEPGSTPASETAPPSTHTPAPETPAVAGPQPTTSRLLEAKRRAQQRKR
jgi:Ca-activated chloride channel homolog